VRMALGAQQGQILRFFLGRGFQWAAFGGAFGLAAALVLVRFMRTMLFQIGPYDPKIFLTMTAVLTAVVLMACLMPALRAARVDPIAALKNE